MKPTADLAVKQVVGQMLGIAPAQLRTDQKLVADLGADSLDLIEIVMAVEEEFAVEISDEVAEKFETVGDIIAHVAPRVPA